MNTTHPVFLDSKKPGLGDLLYAGATLMGKLEPRTQNELLSVAAKYDTKTRQLRRPAQVSDFDYFEQKRISRLADAMLREAQG